MTCELELDNFKSEIASVIEFYKDLNVENAKEIVIKVFSSPDGYTIAPNGVTNLKHKDLEQMGKTEEYSQTYFDMVIPEFK